MNPSATGWIKKHFPTFKETIVNPNYSENNFYIKLQQTGFTYANSVTTLSQNNQDTLKLTLEEKTKVNLFDTLGYLFFLKNPNATQEDYLQELLFFYEEVEIKNTSFFKFPSILKANLYDKAEKVLQQRIQLNENIFQRNFSNLITNALLFLDALAFLHYLTYKTGTPAYIKNLEAVICRVILTAFQQKTEKSHYEELILKLIQSSLRYNKLADINYDLSKTCFKSITHSLEKNYLLDIACIAIYSDERLANKELEFLAQLGTYLNLPERRIQTAVTQMQLFVAQHKPEIVYFDYSNALQHFYKNTNRMVRVLIIRNKRRLIKEISDSRELMLLLHKSTQQELSITEKEKVKTQLLDICKTIPSLAIFILPGGSILLPLLIKFIPQLLPTAFNENLQDN